MPDLSYTVRSPVLDTWEGIKQLKAALWALVSTVLVQREGGEIVKTVKKILHGADHSTCIQGNIGTSNWGLNLLQEENVIPDIVAMAHHCEVLSIRGCVTSKLHRECCV